MSPLERMQWVAGPVCVSVVGNGFWSRLAFRAAALLNGREYPSPTLLGQGLRAWKVVVDPRGRQPCVGQST